MKLTRFYLIAKNLPGTDIFTRWKSILGCLYSIFLPNPVKNIHKALILNGKYSLLIVWIRDKVLVSCFIVSQVKMMIKKVLCSECIKFAKLVCLFSANAENRVREWPCIL